MKRFLTLLTALLLTPFAALHAAGCAGSLPDWAAVHPPALTQRVSAKYRIGRVRPFVINGRGSLPVMVLSAGRQIAPKIV